MSAPNTRINWTPAMDETIRTLWLNLRVDSIGALIGCSGRSVWKRGRTKLGLPPKRMRKIYQPKPETLLAAYRRHSGPAAPFKDIVVGCQRHTVCVARWRAFQDVLNQDDERVSVAGLARVAGFDHTTILSGLKRLKQMEACA